VTTEKKDSEPSEEINDEQRRRWRDFDALSDAARRLITDQSSYSEARWHAVELITEIASWYVFDDGEPDANVALILKAAQAAVERSSVQLSRARAVYAIAHFGRQFAEDVDKTRIVERCVQTLSVWDRGLRDAPLKSRARLVPKLAGLLARYEECPRGKEGKLGAASILAELIVDGDVGDFGLNVLDNLDRTDQIENIRKQLDNAVRAMPTRLGIPHETPEK
jgi:hypothetical protein